MKRDLNLTREIRRWTQAREDGLNDNWRMEFDGHIDDEICDNCHTLARKKATPLPPKVFFLAAMLIVASPVQALKLLSDENAPFAYTDPNTQKITGITNDMVVEACKRAKVPCTIKLVPWARANAFAETDPDTCVYPLARLPERESLFFHHSSSNHSTRQWKPCEAMV